MTLTREEELWGAALALERLHGAGATTYIRLRAAAAEAAGDPSSAATMRAIGERLAELERGNTARNHLKPNQ